MDSKSINHAMAEAILAVINTLNDLDLTAAVINVSQQYPDLQVGVQIGWQDVAGVDLVATHLGLAHASPAEKNYSRRGDVLVYGHPLTVSVYCGRPEAMRAVSVDLSKVAAL